MAKIGTAHIELKPVLNDEALEQITAAITAAVKEGVEAGIKAARPPQLSYAEIVAQRDQKVAVDTVVHRPGVVSVTRRAAGEDD